MRGGSLPSVESLRLLYDITLVTRNVTGQITMIVDKKHHFQCGSVAAMQLWRSSWTAIASSEDHFPQVHSVDSVFESKMIVRIILSS